MSNDDSDGLAAGEPGRGLDMARVRQLIADLERELSRADPRSADVQGLREELATLREHLESPHRRHGWIQDSLHALRVRIEKTAGPAGDELRRDGLFLTEIGRILGL
ncbi:MAG TPA: hypothetical protein PKA20_10120 [Burkholderiaceae bacterium]|nr:hypothetical protein [Burkholderiaceae bacterium]